MYHLMISCKSIFDKDPSTALVDGSLSCHWKRVLVPLPTLSYIKMGAYFD